MISLFLCGEASRIDVDSLARGVAIVITGVFSCIAAFSSLRNHHLLKENGKKTEELTAKSRPGKSPKKNGAPADWYKPPDV
jgi:hypothetical protein